MKIQILELPTSYVGEYSNTPYALIFSEVPKKRKEVAGVADKLTETGNGPDWWIVTEHEVEL